MRVTLDVTLDGAPLPSIVPSDRTRPAITLLSPDAQGQLPARVTLYDEAGNPVGRPEVSLAPGDYAVYYQTVTGTADPWPADGFAPIGSLSITPDTSTAAIDIPTMRVTFRLTMDGASPPPVAGRTPVVTVRRAAPWGGSVTSFELPVVAPAAERVVVRGPVTLGFDRHDGAPDVWPASGDLPDEHELGNAALVDVDVPRHLLTVTVRRAGAAPPEDVELGVVAADAADHIRAEPLGTTVAGVASGYVLPGSHRLRSIGGPDGWPRERWTLEELTVTEDTAIDVDVDPVQVRVGARLDTDLSSGCWERGAVTFGAERLQLPDDGATREADVWLFRGSHVPIYQPPSSTSRCIAGGVWPSHSAHLAPIDVVDGSPIDIAVARVRVTFAVTVDGQPPVAIPRRTDIAPTPPRLVLRSAAHPEDDAHVPLYEFNSDGPMYVPITSAVTLVPGRFDLSFDGRQSTHSQWPGAHQALESNVLFASDSEHMVSLETVAARVDVTLDGGPLPENGRDSWGPGGWPTGILLIGATPGFWKLFPWDIDDPTVIETFEIRAFRGRYDLYYDLPSGFPIYAEGPLPPPGVALGCWEL